MLLRSFLSNKSHHHDETFLITSPEAIDPCVEIFYVFSEIYFHSIYIYIPFISTQTVHSMTFALQIIRQNQIISFESNFIHQ